MPGRMLTLTSFYSQNRIQKVDHFWRLALANLIEQPLAFEKVENDALQGIGLRR